MKTDENGITELTCSCCGKFIGYYEEDAICPAYCVTCYKYTCIKCGSPMTRDCEDEDLKNYTAGVCSNKMCDYKCCGCCV